MHNSLGRLLLLLAAAILLNACSAMRLGYGNADSLARWWMDQYLDFMPEQDALMLSLRPKEFAAVGWLSTRSRASRSSTA
jgi:hypothetical protein